MRRLIAIIGLVLSFVACSAPEGTGGAGAGAGSAAPSPAASVPASSPGGRYDY